MTNMSIRGISLFVEAVGQGQPLVLMHGGPGADHTTLSPFKACADHVRCGAFPDDAHSNKMIPEEAEKLARALEENREETK